MPKRIQRKRAKGWRLPAGCVSVARPGVWGNPFRVGPDGTAAECVARFRDWLTGPEPEVGGGRTAGGVWLSKWNARRAEVRRRLPELRGKDLACWCGEGEPCHADVLLALANIPERP